MFRFSGLFKTLYTRRDLLISIVKATVTIATTPVLPSLESIAHAEAQEWEGETFNPPKGLSNALVLDLNGVPRNYGEHGAPICSERKVYDCTSGIENYLVDASSGKPALIVCSAYWGSVNK